VRGASLEGGRERRGEIEGDGVFFLLFLTGRREGADARGVDISRRLL